MLEVEPVGVDGGGGERSGDVVLDAGVAVGSDAWFAHAERVLKRAFLAALGAELAGDAVSDAMLWASGHRAELAELRNPMGYLYRIGQRRSRPSRRPVPHFPPVEVREPWFEPGLHQALVGLTERQRVAVVLVHGYGWKLREVAELTGLGIPTVQRHVERGMTKLRNDLGVDR